MYLRNVYAISVIVSSLNYPQ